ncbi:PREDICTED: hepatic lectin-like [Poecilia mexicana]|uniref:hepatic lectin-like n=1 Tax=Poecilia mexicana TaxID=48701 RepID=UPI00072DD38A|nr:PREDICTED: hepatic lectin-like [Poecilia mexicana]
MNQQNPEEAAASHENRSRTSKLPAGGVVLPVLVGLLAAALIVIYRLSFVVLETKQSLQIMKEENEALRENISACQQPPAFPPPTAVNMKPPCVQCEPGWELNQMNCYYFNTNKSSWNDSRRSCADLGSDLVKIDSREEQAFLTRRVGDIMENFWDRFWIGLTDSEEEGRWFWVDGSPLDKSLSFWDRLPDDWKGSKGTYPEGEDCAILGTRGGSQNLKCWYDVFCSNSQKSVCEKSPETG